MTNKPPNIINTLDLWAQKPGNQILIWLFVASLVVRIIFCLISPNPYQGLIKGEIISDAVEYDILARNLIEGGGFGFYPDHPTAFRNPLLPFLAAGVYLITGPHPVAVQILMILLGAMIPPVLFALARQYVEPLQALLSASIAVIYPSLVLFSASLMSETLFTLLVLLTLLCWSRFSKLTRGGWGLIILGGVLMGLALLTRTNVAPLILLWLLYLLIDSGTDRWRYILRFCVFICVIFLTIVPWTLRNYAAFGEWAWITTNGGYTIWQRYNLLPPDGTINSRQDVQQELHRIYTLTNDKVKAGEDPVKVFRPYMAETVRGYLLRLGPDQADFVKSFDGLNEFQVDRRLSREAIASIMRFPMRSAVKIIKNTIKFWDPHHDPEVISRYRRYNWYYGIMAPFMIWGIWLTFPQRRRFMLLYLTIIAFWAVTSITLLVERYRLPVEAIGLIFASVAVVTLFRNSGKPWIPWAVIGAVVLINLLLMTFGGPILHNIRENIHNIG